MSWGATVFGVVAGVGLFLPGPTKDFMLAHPLWGWGALLALATASRPFMVRNMRTLEERQSKIWGQRIKDLSNHWAGEERRLAAEFREKEFALFKINSKKDDDLLNERLSNMEVNSDFHIYLAEGVDHKNLRSSFIFDLEDRLAGSRRDWREFFDPGLAEAWQRFTLAAEAYKSKTQEYMWDKEKSDNLHVPPEWKGSDHKRYQIAFRELDECRTALYVSLNELHRIQHAQGISAKQQLLPTSSVPAGMARNNLLDPPPIPKQG